MRAVAVIVEGKEAKLYITIKLTNLVTGMDGRRSTLQGKSLLARNAHFWCRGKELGEKFSEN